MGEASTKNKPLFCRETGRNEKERERKEKSRKISNGRRHGTHNDLHAPKTTEVVETARVQNVFLRLGRKKENYAHVCKNENV